MSLSSSPLGRGGHRDDRRRRLLTEEVMLDAGSPENALPASRGKSSPPPAHKSANYGDAEFLKDQLRLTDLIPRHPVAFVLLGVFGLAAIGSLLALYAWSPEILRAKSPRPLMLDLDNPGNLGNWLSSLLLLAAAALATIVYTVRRHKVDDYGGRYRVWLWAAGGWFVLATDAAASLHQGVQQCAVALAGTPLVGDGSIWWVVPSLVLLAAVGSRLVADMWSSRVASTVLILASLAYVTAIVTGYRWVTLETARAQILVFQGAALLGHLLLALSMGLQARYVILDAEGRLPRREAKKRRAAGKKAETKRDAAKPKSAITDESSSDEADEVDFESGEEEAADDDSNDAWVAVDPPHPTAPPVLKRVLPASNAAPSPGPTASAAKPTASASNASSDSDLSGDKLSKADRKALKKRLLDERLKREQKKAASW